jgi:hypothetical protein
MGYDLHISRNDEWWDEQIGGGISFAEWASFVDADDTMRMDGFAEVELPDGSTLRTENEGLAVWTDYAGNEDGGNQAWFDFRGGAIVVKNPDQDILAKMLEIAVTFNAKVVGDEGEQYESPTDHGVPTRTAMRDMVAAQCKPWWKFW